jgi:hypothetical protein
VTILVNLPSLTPAINETDLQMQHYRNNDFLSRRLSYVVNLGVLADCGLLKPARAVALTFSMSDDAAAWP